MDDNANDISVNVDIEYMSKEGFQKMQEQLEELKTKERLRIAERLEYAKSLGDLYENAEFDAAKEDQMLNEMKIRELEDMLSRAKIVTKGKNDDTVRIGSNIVVEAKASSLQAKYTIVGSEEANPAQGMVSHESPLGRSFLGRKKGEKVKVVTPKGETEYVIIDVA